MIPIKWIFSQSKHPVVDEISKSVKKCNEEYMNLLEDAGRAVALLKKVEDMTDSEKMGLLIASGCEINFIDGKLTTRHPCGIILHDGEYRIYEDSTPQRGTNITFLKKSH